MGVNKGLFKSKGEGILKRPRSMDEFINDSNHQKMDSHAQTFKTGPVQYTSTEEKQTQKINQTAQIDMPDVRLHVFIRGELEIKLLDEVNRRKQNPTMDRRLANKRTVVEQALEKFL